MDDWSVDYRSVKLFESAIVLKTYSKRKGLFTWKEEKAGTRKILQGGITLRWVYVQKFRPVREG